MGKGEGISRGSRKDSAKKPPSVWGRMCRAVMVERTRGGSLEGSGCAEEEGQEGDEGVGGGEREGEGEGMRVGLTREVRGVEGDMVMIFFFSLCVVGFKGMVEMMRDGLTKSNLWCDGTLCVV